ncbi:MAG: hypothetical protein NT062_18685 [Proteobacteria bacterium]|nr:hypothetical protein [Pseudomonadota bacterium]
MRDAVAGVIVVALAACGASAKQQAQREQVAFNCKERIASYVASHHMAGDEVGVQLDCTDGPRVKRWKTDKAGKRNEETIPLSPIEFEKVWREIDGTGWPNMKDCLGGTAGKNDPVYVFDIKDDQNQVSFSCQSRSMPYPYDKIVDPLDMVGLNHKGQLGDDEPDDLKKFDKRDLQK